jgi:uncharacterized protein YicC (UPF0701 family)
MDRHHRGTQAAHEQASAHRRANRDDVPTGELDALLDRFLALFHEASRRFGHLFPYHHLRDAIARRVGRGAIELTITSEGGDASRAMCVIEDGALVRTRETTGPVRASWSIQRETIEDAARRPWVYLAHPEHFALGWFTAHSSSMGRVARHGSPMHPRP